MVIIDKLYHSFAKHLIRRPVNFIFFVTAMCDSGCLHCFNWRSLNKNTQELSLDEIDGFAKYFKKIPNIGFSGGEPLLRKDLEQIISIFETHSSTRSFGIPTNCLRPKAIFEEIKSILEKHPHLSLIVYLSLDGTKEIHDYLRGIQGAFERVIETYQLLSKLKKKYPLILKVATTVSNKNIDNIPGLILFVKNNMPDIDFQSFEIMRGNPKDKTVTLPSIEKLKSLRPAIFNSFKRMSFYQNSPLSSKIAASVKKFVFDTYLELLERKKQFFPCYAGTLNLVLMETGDVHFCELTERIGNIRHQPISEILKGKKAKEVRRKIKNRECWCVHSCFQINNILLTQSMWPKIFKYLFHDLIKTTKVSKG